MQGKCSVCGIDNVELEQKNIQGEDKNVCATCANE